MSVNILITSIVTFAASVLGSICGIGGGIIIKPSIDAFAVNSIEVTNFLCTTTVFATSLTSALLTKKSHDEIIEEKTAVPLGIGCVFGGILGSLVFSSLKELFDVSDTIASVQACLLIAVILLTIAYTLKKFKIESKQISSLPLIALIGASLGLISSFLGIGGGSLNIVALEFFFSFDTKKATQNSLFVIMISQGAAILTTIVTGVPHFELSLLVIMIVCAVFGGAVGKKINTQIAPSHIDKLFVFLNLVTIAINIFNISKFGF